MTSESKHTRDRLAISLMLLITVVGLFLLIGNQNKNLAKIIREEVSRTRELSASETENDSKETEYLDTQADYIGGVEIIQIFKSSTSANQTTTSTENVPDNLSPTGPDSDILASLICNPSQIAQWSGLIWVCANQPVGDLNTDNQELALSSDQLGISGGNTVDLTQYKDNTDDQDISLLANQLSIQNGSSVDLGVYLDNTDTLANLSCTANQNAQWSGTTWICANDIDTDTDTTYSSSSGLQLIGTTFGINSPLCSGTDKLSWNGSAFICLADIDTDTDTDDQTLGWDSNTRTLSLIAGGDVVISDSDTDTDDQSLNLSNNSLQISEGNSVDLSAYLDNTDTQDLSWNAATRTLNLIDGGSVIISDVDTDTLSGLSCTANQVAKYISSTWACANDIDTDTDTDTTYTAGSGISINGSNVISASLGVDINSAEIVDGTISPTDLAASSVVGGTGGSVQDNSLTAADLGSDSVNSSEIASSAVGTSEIATGAVTSDEILDGTILLEDIGTNSCTANQILKYSGTSWICAIDVDTDTDTTYSAGAGVDISGSNIISTTLGLSIDSSEITDETILTDDIADDVITTEKILDGTLTFSDFASNGCTSSEVIKYDGLAWICATDIDTDTTYGAGSGITIDGSNIISTSLGSDIISGEIVDGTIATQDIADDAITSGKILDGSILSSDIADGTIIFADWSSNGCTTNQVPQYTGTAWTCSSALPTYVRLNANVINNNAVANTLQDVTGLNFSVQSGIDYTFRCTINFTSAVATTGSRWSINGPTTSVLSYTSSVALTTATNSINNLVAYNLPAASSLSSAATTGNLAIIDGVINATANGTVQVRFASEVASSAITAKAGSSCTVTN